ncbi:hypothetical protein HPB52_003650 [Rhipicephalus sanguineus]|uniref:F-box domain-containing protein n=1 Tax=Rhipicephalus sanguineus TaxID=34632 RepID=A0A9D4Q9Q3_RHISA|nr:hypothetical protein HPB52_003650 [Rhipicephalus sanguineus]
MAALYGLLPAWLRSLLSRDSRCPGEATSSTPAASQPSRVASDFVAPLPPELWVEIFRHLDVESLLNLAEAVPQWKDLAFSPTVVRSVTFDQGTDERIVEKFLLATRENLVREEIRNKWLALDVRELRLTNCIALPSEVIIDVTRRCYNLRELYCVNCVVEPYELFRHLCWFVQGIKKVEWTLYDKRYYRYEDSLDVWPIEHLYGGMAPGINEMYVEVFRCDETVAFLDSFVKRCQHLYRLHVHNVWMEYYPELNVDAVSANFVPDKHGPLEITDRLPHLEILEYTYEMPLSPNMDARLPVIRNNIAWQRNSVASRYRKPAPSFNVVGFDDVVKGEVSLGSREQVTVVMRGNVRAASLFEEAASKPALWKDVTRLTLVYVPLALDENPIPSTAGPRNCEKPIRQFFEACVSRLTELNLSTSHFTGGGDCCFLVASTLHNLRSLALPPCGANLEHSLAWLAHGCKLLESLDVRSVPTVEGAGMCEACKPPLLFTAGCFEVLHRETRLRRLSIDETAQIVDLEFLSECRVEDLRISVENVKNGDFSQCPKVLGQLLASNPRLASLTLVARGAPLCITVAETLWQVQSLRNVCVLTTTIVSLAAVAEFFVYLEHRLPALLTAHMHYEGEGGVARASTWVRPRQPGLPSRSVIPMMRSSNVIVVYRRPCLGRLCCVDGFTGLVRPRNRS